MDADGETGEEAYDDEELASQRPDGAVIHTETFVSNDGGDVLDLSVTIDPIVREHVEQHDDENDFLQVSMRFQAESENEDYSWLVGEMLHNPAIGGTVDEVRLIDADDTPDTEDGIPVRSPLADRNFGGDWEGTTTDSGTATVIWPAAPGIERVTVDVPEATGNITDREGEPWRAEDVPVGSAEESEDAEDEG